jgi:hypothetical protein
MKKFEHKRANYKALIYGQAGSGKTRLSATAELDERLAPALMLEAFGNPISLGDYPKIPDILTVEKMADFNPVYNWLAEGQKKDAQFAKDFDLKPPYKTVIVDGLTEVQRFVMNMIRNEEDLDPGKLVKLMDWPGFNRLLGTMLNWANHFVSLDMNVILTSLEKVESQKVYSKPLLWGQSGNELCGYVHQVVRLTTQLAAPKVYLRDPNDPVIVRGEDKTNNVALFRETPTYYAKDQYGIPVEHMTDPTLGKILDLIERSSQTSN